jgi:hypothetical protein
MVEISVQNTLETFPKVAAGARKLFKIHLKMHNTRIHRGAVGGRVIHRKVKIEKMYHICAWLIKRMEFQVLVEFQTLGNSRILQTGFGRWYCLVLTALISWDVSSIGF